MSACCWWYSRSKGSFLQQQQWQQQHTLTGRLMPVKNSGMIMGSTVASSNTRLASFRPAMSVHLYGGSSTSHAAGFSGCRCTVFVQKAQFRMYV